MCTMSIFLSIYTYGNRSPNKKAHWSKDNKQQTLKPFDSHMFQKQLFLALIQLETNDNFNDVQLEVIFKNAFNV